MAIKPEPPPKPKPVELQNDYSGPQLPRILC
jgi:hypothetical protein